MKKIVLIVATILIVISCSKNEESTTLVPINKNKMKEDLIGTWKLIGYYDDVDGDPVTGTNYHLIENGSEVVYYSNGTFDLPAQTSNPIGNYTVSVDSLLTLNYNENFTWNPNGTYTNKITLLTNEYLELSALPSDGVEAATERYEKVTSP